MTVLNDQAYSVLCKFCANCQELRCVADVPWYAVTVGCKYFTEGDVVPRTRPQTMKQIMRKTLVDTF